MNKIIYNGHMPDELNASLEASLNKYGHAEKPKNSYQNSPGQAT